MSNIRSKCNLFPNRDISWYIDFVICGYGKVTAIAETQWNLKMNCCWLKNVHTETEEKGDVFVAAEGQLDAAESHCVTDLCVSSTLSGSPGIFLLVDKPYHSHQSGRLNTKCSLSVNNNDWQVNLLPLAVMRNQLYSSLLTVWSFTICE